MISPSTTELPSRSSRTTGNARDANSPRINSTGRNIVTGLPAGDSRRSDGSVQGERLRADRHGGASLFFGGNCVGCRTGPLSYRFLLRIPAPAPHRRARPGQERSYGDKRIHTEADAQSSPSAAVWGKSVLRTLSAWYSKKSAPKNGRRQCSH